MTDKEPQNKEKKGKKPSQAKLLAWYDAHRRVMPWRATAGQRSNPYHVWLSEIMLQQTTVAAVGPYFIRFVGRWPTLASLAKASLDEVFQMWAGLGYYRRARSLHECATVLMRDYGGVFPQEYDELLKLPGLGPYTAAAVAAIAFDRRANVVDGNVERVMARVFAVMEALPKSKQKLKHLAAENLPTSRYGDYAQALMDLGATICTPRSPKCDACPWRGACRACALGIAESLPKREVKTAKPVRRAFAFVLQDKNGQYLLRKRPPKGLLASMMEIPSTPWNAGKKLAWGQAEGYAPAKTKWKLLSGVVHHTFTHFELELQVAVASVSGARALSVDGVWVKPSALADQALPSVMRKVLSFAKDKRD